MTVGTSTNTDKFMTSRNIVVTGASGFIGSRVAEALAKTMPASAVHGVGRKAEPEKTVSLPNYRYLQHDMLAGDLTNVLPDKADVVIHLAGDRRTFVQSHEFTPQMHSNVLMTALMADYACFSGAALFLYASTVYVYSGNDSTPFTEDVVAIPRDNLGATKMASESLLKARAVAGQFKALSFRIGTVYGPGASSEQFIPQAIMKLSAPGPHARFGPGDVKRDFVYIDDVSTAFVKGVEVLYEQDFTYDALNVGTNRATSIRDIVEILADTLDTKKEIEFGTFQNVGSKADTDHQLDVSRISSVLGWKPEISVEEGLRRTIPAFQ